MLQKLGGANGFVVRLEATMRDERHLYFVLEWAPHGDLWAFLRTRTPHRRLEEVDMVRFVAAEVACALQLLHGNGILHRDLKPEVNASDGSSLTHQR